MTDLDMEAIDSRAYAVVDALNDLSMGDRMCIISTAYGIMVGRSVGAAPEASDKAAGVLNALRQSVMLGCVMEIQKQRGEWDL